MELNSDAIQNKEFDSHNTMEHEKCNLIINFHL